MKLIDTHNTRTDQSFTMGMNSFGDLTSAEYAAKVRLPYAAIVPLNVQLTPRMQIATRSSGPIVYDYPHESVNLSTLPASQDWRSSGCVASVANQGSFNRLYVCLRLLLRVMKRRLNHGRAMRICGLLRLTASDRVIPLPQAPTSTAGMVRAVTESTYRYPHKTFNFFLKRFAQHFPK